jgi:hypothetical protein
VIDPYIFIHLYAAARLLTHVPSNPQVTTERKSLMLPSATAFAVFTLTVLVSVLLALLAAVGAGLLARVDGLSLPAALQRAGVAFGGTLTLLVGLLAVGISMLK